MSVPARIEQHILLLDLVPSSSLIGEYVRHHAAGNVPAAITASIRDAGIVNMRIYRLADRLAMLMDVDADKFSFDAKALADQSNPAVQDWERRMDAYQKAVPLLDGESNQGGKWQVSEEIFNLSHHT